MLIRKSMKASIVLDNFLFKIIIKISTDCLREIASRIVSPSNLWLFKGMKKRGISGNMSIKVKIRKAFDTMKWKFLFNFIS